MSASKYFGSRTFSLQVKKIPSASSFPHEPSAGFSDKDKNPLGKITYSLVAYPANGRCEYNLLYFDIGTLIFDDVSTRVSRKSENSKRDKIILPLEFTTELTLCLFYLEKIRVTHSCCYFLFFLKFDDHSNTHLSIQQPKWIVVLRSARFHHLFPFFASTFHPHPLWLSQALCTLRKVTTQLFPSLFSTLRASLWSFFTHFIVVQRV